ncbi:MAG TPA: hypothetical protein VKA10_04740, partial [Prolixibacteraceae bacterium]|nr:hypothetical protein [Prolixibacteraceae bacterium]
MISSKYITASFQLLFFITITHFLFAQETENQHQVWMTYYKGRDLKQDFKDMKAHGVDAIEVGIWGIQGNSRAKNVLIAARQNNLKLIIGIPEVAEQAFKFENENPERAVMMGGAYKGKAIDRFRFPFTPKEHSITIESPVYDSTNCYGDIGRYFMGLTPVKAEVVIKQADFDGQQHLQIIDAQIKSQKQHYWNMQFDLTGVKGDLDNVVLAVYWISKGTRDYWIFGDAVSMYSDGFKQQLKQEVKSVVNDWKGANNGVFPPEIIAVRYGDECFHISGHLNSDACSYPMWDFSESAIRHFRNASKMEYPRGVGWTDMFGHESYAKWMYNFHEAAAQSVKIVKETLLKEGIENLPVFRNTTRMNAFDVMNDWDGSGQELLSRQLDILHIDPYPVNANGYNKNIIPRDMSYIEGFSKRFDKPIVPWMQAHVYGHLKHPTPQHISRMMEQQLQFNIQNIMWLGYGYNNSGNTFPSNNAESWKQAKKEHSGFKNATIQKNKADFAVIRPYTARSMRGKNRISADEFLTDYLVEKALFNFNLHYDVFEPLSCNELKPEELKSYSFIVAEIGVLNEKTLQPFILSKVPTILIIAGAEIE